MKTAQHAPAQTTAPKIRQTWHLGGLTIVARAQEWDDDPLPVLRGEPRAVRGALCEDVLDTATGQRVEVPIAYAIGAADGHTYPIVRHRDGLLLHYSTLSGEDLSHVEPLSVDQMLDAALTAERAAAEKE